MASSEEMVAPRLVPRPAEGFVQAFFRHLARAPDRVACASVVQEGRALEARGVSFAEVARQAGRFAAAFDSCGLTAGQRVLVSMADPRQLLALLLATMSRGLAAVPLQSSNEFSAPEVFLRRLQTIAADCRPSQLLVDSGQSALDWRSLGIPLLEADRLPEGAPLAPGAGDPVGGDCAFIQYTSGSSGDPKGVVITNDNLAANLTGIGLALHVTAADSVLSWLPLHHDMGLIGALLFAVYWRIPVNILSPISFLVRPHSWLEAVDRLGATLTVAPTFAYSICCRKVPSRYDEGLDLSRCRTALCGAEPIDPDVVRTFCDRFARRGFRPSAFFPVYGLAEATLAVSFPRWGDPPLVDHLDRQRLVRDGVAHAVAPTAPGAVGVVSVGYALPGHTLRIVDPQTGEALGDRRVGEVRVSGPSISPGYFSAGCRAGPGPRELRTGDLGYLARGRLFVVDRLKDLVIIAGRNYAPSDLESCVAAVEGLRLGRIVAFSRPGSQGTEALQIVAELAPGSWRSQRAIQIDVRLQISRHFGLSVEQVTLVAPGSLPKTSSGKLRRPACKQRYGDGAHQDGVSLGGRIQIKWRRLARLGAWFTKP